MLLIYVWLLLSFLQTVTLTMDVHSTSNDQLFVGMDIDSGVVNNHSSCLDHCINGCHGCLERCPIVGPICYRSWGDPNFQEHYNQYIYQDVEADRQSNACCLVIGSVVCIPICIVCACHR